jgi:hypothetical protein
MFVIPVPASAATIHKAGLLEVSDQSRILRGIFWENHALISSFDLTTQVSRSLVREQV